MAEPSTRMEMFLNGQAGYVVGLDARTTWTSTPLPTTCYYERGRLRVRHGVQPRHGRSEDRQENAGENINKTILTVKDFRMAMSLAMDRQAFCLATAPTNAPAFALYGSQIVADPENGVFYRATDVAKQVVVDFWEPDRRNRRGQDCTPPWTTPSTAITGYNLEMAKTYFDSAYDHGHRARA